MSYAGKTFQDRNPLKRYFQASRLRHALRLGTADHAPAIIMDFGAGNGEMCKHLATAFPGARIICYEPHPELREQARENLAGYPAVTVTGELPSGRADLLFCLEVFEHLPEREAAEALEQISGLLSDEGRVVFGVPVETGLPALFKGLFRMARRFGAFDARPGNILRALIGRPPTPRPVVELMPGSWYHLDHLGFDHRQFRQQLESAFRILKIQGSPFTWLGALFNSEVHFLVTPRDGGVG